MDNVTDMNNMFSECSSLKSLPDISNWKTNKVINMSIMFCECSSLISLPDINKWNTSNVTNLSRMFYKCSSLKILPDISVWNIMNVKDISLLFGYCTSLYFLPNILKWNFDNIDGGDDFYEGLKIIDFNKNLSILEGNALTHKKNNYINLLGIIDKKYPKSTWLPLEPQDVHINSHDNNLQDIISKNIFNNFKYIKITNNIKENNKIQIFSNDFIRTNKNKYKIVYKNKIYSSYNNKFSISGNNSKISLKLILFGNISINDNNDIKGYISTLKYDEYKGYKQIIN